MILLLIPLAGVFIGLGLWAAMQGLGVLNMPGAERSSGSGGPRAERTARYERGSANSVRERLGQVRPGCLVAIIAAAGVWILGWLIVLIVGLSFLN